MHAFLPSGFTYSEAYGTWSDGASTYIAGYAYNAAAGRTEALMWIGPVPEPASGLALGAGLAALAISRRRSRSFGR